MANPACSVIIRSAPAKINLSLAVLGLRPDGYHEIESWVVKIDLCDELRFEIWDSLSLTMSGGCEGLAADESNLVIKAARLLAERAAVGARARIHLDKRIPAQAGLGGGSSDAASTLLGLNQLWGLGWAREKLAEVAVMIGSDVPLFLHEGSAVIRGRGELIERVAMTREYWVGLVAPGFGLPTVDVYRALDKQSVRRESPTRPWIGGAESASTLSGKLFNDLTSPAIECEPRLGELMAKIEGATGRRVHMTGSGSGLFAIFDARDEALAWDRAVTRVLSPHDRHEVVRTVD
jgi:4-diphosphocytidyl-2-C-methyl-D-erythritol kinase